MARIGLGVATSAGATFIGSDQLPWAPVRSGKTTWQSRIANEGLLFSYGATEPEASIDLGTLHIIADL